MAQYDDIIAMIHEMELADLSLLQADLTKITQDKALKELARREDEINQLRLMAGMKKKPIKKDKDPNAPSVTGARRGPKPKVKAAE